MKMTQKHHCEKKTTSSLYRIGMFAMMNHVTIKTLRYYEDQELLLPAYIDKDNGYRFYTMDQMAILHQITALKQIGLTLEEIKIIQSQDNTIDFLIEKKKDILNQIAQLTEKLACLESYINHSYMSITTPVLIQTIPAVTCATMEKRIHKYDDLFDVMPTLGMEMEKQGCQCDMPEYCFTHYLESGYKDENILIEVCEAVKRKGQDTDIITFQDFPEVKAACIYHYGSYQNFPQTYEKILRYIENNHYEICGHIREKYIDGIWNKESEKEWLSEIQIPVKRK